MNNNFSSSPFTPIGQPSGQAPAAPPPPTEVKVRTMRSDLASMAKSGGGLPRFEDVKVAGLSFEKKAAGQAVVAGAEAEAKKKNLIFLVIAFAVIAVVGALIYAAYRLFFAPNSPSEQPLPQQAAPQSNPLTAPLPAF